VWNRFSTKPVGEGTGLGLSTVHGIVQQSSGYVRVLSETGKGTTFHIYFPRHEAPPDPIAEEIEPAVVSGSETVLLVEDDAAFRETTARMLANGGYKVLEAADAKAALAVSKQHEGEIHLLLTDVIMPRMNGNQLASALKQSRSHMAVLFMSGHTGGLLAHHGVVESYTALLRKPFTERKLLSQVRALLDRRAGVPPGAATVLLVDDNRELREVARRILEESGYTVVESSSGEQAIELANGHPHPIHVLVTDVSLPGISGITLAERLLSRIPGLKVLYVSGYSGKIGIGAEIAESGGAFLEKFKFVRELSRKVGELLDRAGDKPNTG
jgi:CheY-like chemotaxis protein